jgi:crotonobetainyl-CoA:carnitine CoA-transferase CaiB-like acyl-CoA transferase
MQLADMGAEVLKVEQPGSGDETRSYIPPEINGESTCFMSLNKNKKGITLNLKSEACKY